MAPGASLVPLCRPVLSLNNSTGRWPVIRFCSPPPLEESMGLEPENGPERHGQPIVRARPLVKGGAGHERLTPLVLRAQQGESDAINQVVSELAPGVLRAMTALL